MFTAKRAARGAGLPWGIAEEAGKAVRWLAENGLPGPEALAAELTAIDGTPVAEVAPDSEAMPWTATSGHLSPLLAGPAIADRAAAMAAGATLALGPVARPLLILPFAATAAKVARTPVDLTWNGRTVTVFAHTFCVTGDAADLSVAAEGLGCRRSKAQGLSAPPLPARRSIDPAAWDRLAELAHRTFAPATKASRIGGAGAGLTDND